MAMLRVIGSNTAAIFVTCPTLTPLNSTGEPTDSPVIEPEKNITKVNRFWKNLPDPKTTMATTASAMAPTTKAPISVFLDCLATARLLATGQEGAHARVLRFGQKLLRVARSDHRLAFPVQEDRVVADGKDAGELVRHDHDGGAEAVAQIEDEIVEPPRAHRVEPRRRLVEEEDVRVERHRARQAGALRHAAADLRRVVLLEAGETHERELQRGHRRDLFRPGLNVFLQREGHVLRQGHRAPERSALVEHSEASQEALAFRRRHFPETSAGALVEDRPPGRLVQSDEVPEQRALPAAAPSHDDEDVALVDREVEILHDHRAAVRHGEIAHRDLGTRLAALFRCRGHRRCP